MAAIGQEPPATATAAEEARTDAGLAVLPATSQAVERGVRERAGQAHAAGSQAADRPPLTPELAVGLRAFRNARYHEDREGYYSALGRWSNFIGIILGSAAFAGGAAAWPALAMIGGALAAIISASRLVFDFSGKARTHQELRKSFLEILASSKKAQPDAAALEEKMVTLYKGEPEVYNAVNALAYNEAQRAFGREWGLINVTPWQSFCRHFFRYQLSDFPNQS